jgi:uncharacterized membrane protein YeaQ/YmgE (transglycosylase-associated protein family)
MFALLNVLIIGLIVGAIARLIVRGKEGFLVTMTIGIAGSFVAFYLGRLLGWTSGNPDSLRPVGFIPSLLGAILLLLVYHWLRRSFERVETERHEVEGNPRLDLKAEQQKNEEQERLQHERHSGSRRRWSLFLCYRRSDSRDAVDRIYERLCRDLGKSKLFRDIDSIPLGVNFPNHIATVLQKCCAVLVVIGPKWLEARSPDGRRRLDDPQDHVRVEIECALRAGNVHVIPIRVGEASMPKPEEVPESIRTLVEQNGVEVRPDPDFQGDASRLARRLRELIAESSPTAYFFGRVFDFIRPGGR